MSSSASPADLADAIRQQAVRASGETPGIRGADWQTATVTAVGTDGTVDCGIIRARRLESYPTPLVGDRIVIVQSGIGNWLACGRVVTGADAVGHTQVARKTGDTSRTNTNTPTDDPHLAFQVSAGATYIVDGWVKYSALVDVDITIDWSTPAGALGEWTGHGMGLGTTGQTSGGYLIRTESSDVSQARNYGGTTGTAGEYSVLIMGTLRVQAAGGTYALQWAQGTAGASPTTVYTDSWLRLTRVA